MPSDFIRNIFPRRLRHRDGEETVTSQPANKASEKATSCALQGPPPPYASENPTLVDNNKEILSSSPSIQANTPQLFTQPESKLYSIQTCPHATSSFERIQRIVRLPNFKQSYEGLDALTPGSDHRNPFTSGFRLCKPDSGSDLCIKGWGKYLYDKYGTAYPRKDKTLSMAGEGLVLNFYWMINFVNVPREQRQSTEDIDRLLSQTKVEFCTHTTLSHPMVVAAVYRILHPEDNEVDPIDMWEAGCNNGTTTVACEECETVAEIHGVGASVKVDTKRYLGGGEDSADRAWRAQCGVREGARTVNEKLN